MDSHLLQQIFEKYYNKKDTMYRLPLSEDLDTFWEEEMKLRKKNARMLPLHSYDGKQYFYNRTDRFIKAADEIMAIARDEVELSGMDEYAFLSMTEEAVFSSSIEGAFSTKERLHDLIQHHKPKNKDEKMVLNNFRALEFVKANIDHPIDEGFILKIGEILTEGTLDDGVKTGYRDDFVHVVSHVGEVLYTAPEAKYVKPMMSELVSYISNPTIHPIEKAAVAHIFFVTIHPFFDGNGRTARAISYAILLKAGYNIINLVPISGVLANERGKYYKSILSCQETENGYDYTYFTDYYTELLAKTIKSLLGKAKALAKYDMLIKENILESDSRVGKGALWLANERITVITAEKWKNKFGVSFETARKDLFELENTGFVKRRVEGRKMFFDVVL